MKICYVGPVRDHSGYGETSRNHVASLVSAGVDLTISPLQYTLDMAEFGKLGKLVDSYINKQIDYDIRLLHATPDQYVRLAEPGKYNIGFLYWETNKVPADFVPGLNLCNEVWTASEANADAARAGGVSSPIYVFPQPMDAERVFGDPFRIIEFDGFMFYSIFEWIERKNPRALLHAYWQEFQHGENVGLLLKTYHRNFADRNKRLISSQLESLKKEVSVEKYAPVFLYKELMNRDDVGRLHSTGDAFVSAHRGEGWGLPQAEALLAGNPVISTGYGGVHEYLVNKRDAMIVPYDFCTVSGMEAFSKWYSIDQEWADPNIAMLQKYMRYVFENRDEASKIGFAGQALARAKFDYAVVGRAMANRLKLIKEERI